MLRASPEDIYEVMGNRGQVLSGPLPLKALEPVTHSTGRFQLIGNSRLPWRTAGVLVAMYLNSAAALAAIEEVNQESGGQDESLLSLSGGLSKDIYDNISVQNVNSKQLDEDLIPATVWDIQINPGTSLYRIRDGLESELYTGFDSTIDGAGAWFRTATTVWSGYKRSRLVELLLTPPQLQVASCGVNQAEHKDLDHCTGQELQFNEENTRSKIIEAEGNISTGSDNSAPVSVNSSANNTTTSSANNQYTQTPPSPPTTAFISNSVSSLIGNSLSQEDLTLLAYCDGSSASCTKVQISPPATSIALLASVSQSSSPGPVDLPNSEGGDKPPSTDLPPVLAPLSVVPMILAPPEPLAPEPIADPLTPDLLPPEPFAALSLASDPLKPIPEASTWVMTVIGSCFMAILFRNRGRRRANPISIIDVPELS